MVSLNIKTVSNLFRIGHCGPTVMYTIGQAMDAKDDRIIKLSSGMPGGIANLGSECGGITSPSMNICLKHSRTSRAISLGNIFISRFRNSNGTINCREILKNERNPLPCIKAICSASEIYMQMLNEDFSIIDKPANTADKKVLDYFSDNRFHCTNRVLYGLEDFIKIDEKLLSATWGFIGGTMM